MESFVNIMHIMAWFVFWEDLKEKRFFFGGGGRIWIKIMGGGQFFPDASSVDFSFLSLSMKC